MTPGPVARRARLIAPLSTALLLAACGTTVPLSGQGAAGNPLGDGLGASSAPSSSSTDVTGTTGATAPDLTSGTTGVPGATSPGGAPKTVSSSAAVPGAPSTGTGATSTIAAKGRGWDQKVVHVGVTTTNDISTVGNTLGLKSVNPGNLRDDANAMVGYVNAHGGLFGRKVVAEFYDVSTGGDPTTVGQQICTHFTQDVAVIGLINMTTNGDTSDFDACIAKAHLPTLAWITDTGDDASFASRGGYYNNLPFPSWSRFAHPFVQRLLAQGYFGGWDSTNGKPGKAPVKVGLLEQDTPIGHQIAALLIKELKAVGHAPNATDVIFVSGESDLSSSEVKFRADGVTHVIGLEILFLFMETYEAQHYRPRYGINSGNAPSLFLEGTAPAAQLVGSMGVGVTPTIDVFASHDPGAKASPACRCARASTARRT